MARKRMIDPSFWSDEQLGECSIECRLLFMGLISQADDEGRLNGHPALIRSNIFPYDHQITADKVDEWLGILSERKFIVRYVVNNQKYILVKNFNKHQTINKPQKSKLPEPPTTNYGSDTVAVQENERNSHDQKKLKEEKLKEGEGKGKEEKDRAHEIESIKDRLRDLCNAMNIQGFTVYHLDIVYSYIGMVEIEVIEAAIKKSQNKPNTYLTNTLHGMINVEKITRKDQLPGAKVGEVNGGTKEGVRQGGGSFDDKPITGGKSGVLPSQWSHLITEDVQVS